MSDRDGYIITDQYAIYFLTFTIVGWVDIFTRKECKDIIVDSLKYCNKNKGLSIHAYVIMSNHIHLIVSAREGSGGLSGIIRDFKKHTSKQLLSWVKESNQESRKGWMELVFRYHAKYNKNNSKYQVWQQNSKPMICMHPKFTMQKLLYIHMNPVRAGIVDEAENYAYSSAVNYAGGSDSKLELDIIDYGNQIGYVFS